MGNTVFTVASFCIRVILQQTMCESMAQRLLKNQFIDFILKFHYLKKDKENKCRNILNP